MKSIVKSIFSAAVVAACGLSLVRPTAAQESAHSAPCTARTIHGSYGIRFSGEWVGHGQFVSISSMSLDGVGEFTTHEVLRLNGADGDFAVDRTFTGPYVVNPDCTGYLDFSSTLANPPIQAHGDFVIVNGGKTLFIIDNEDNFVASGVAERY